VHRERIETHGDIAACRRKIATFGPQGPPWLNFDPDLGHPFTWSATPQSHGVGYALPVASTRKLQAEASEVEGEEAFRRRGVTWTYRWTAGPEIPGRHAVLARDVVRASIAGRARPDGPYAQAIEADLLRSIDRPTKGAQEAPIRRCCWRLARNNSAGRS